MGGFKGVKFFEAFGERSRDWFLGYVGDEGFYFSMMWEISGLLSSGGFSVRFFMRYDGEVSEFFVGR